VDTFDAVLAAGDADVGLGPFNAGDADTETVRVRMVCPLGPAAAAFSISGPMSVPDFWRSVCGYIRADPARRQANADVLAWGRVALLAPAVGAQNRAAMLPALESVVLQGDVLESILDLVKRDLPGLRPGVDDPMNLVAQSMGQLVAGQQQQQALAMQQRLEDKQENSPKDLYKGALLDLLRLCEVTSEADLPAVYTKMAQAKKADQLNAAQRHLNSLVNADQTHGTDAPIISADAFKKILEPRWYSLDPDDVSDGVNPFHTVFVSTAQNALLAKDQQRYTLLLGGNTVLLSELIQFEELAKLGLAMPVTWPQLKRTLVGYYFIAWGFLGLDNRLTKHISSSIKDALARESKLQDKFETRPDLVILVIRRWQQRLQEYQYQHARAVSYTDVPLPDLKSMWYEILEDSWNAPSLPPSLAGSSGSSTDDSSRAGFSVGGQSHSSGSALSSLTGQSAPSPAQFAIPPGWKLAPESTKKTDGDQHAGTLIARPGGAVPKVVELAGVGWSSRGVKEEFKDSWPKSKAGFEMCLPWHYKGRCYSNCGRRNDHVVHDADDAATLCAFLDAKFKKHRKNG
jgi:hypothetical protein